MLHPIPKWCVSGLTILILTLVTATKLLAQASLSIGACAPFSTA